MHGALTATSADFAVIPEGTGSTGSLRGRYMCSSGRSAAKPRVTDNSPLCTWRGAHLQNRLRAGRGTMAY